MAGIPTDPVPLPITAVLSSIINQYVTPTVNNLIIRQDAIIAWLNTAAHMVQSGGKTRKRRRKRRTRKKRKY